MIFFMVSASGDFPDELRHEEILIHISKSMSMNESILTYRSGPEVNDPLQIVFEIERLNKPWSFCFIYEDLHFVIFTKRKNEEILRELKDSKWEGHLTGEIVEAYLNNEERGREDV